jgi:hypothetical protein
MQIPTCSFGNQSRVSGPSGEKRKSGNLVVLGEEKKPRQELVAKNDVSITSNLIVLSPQKDAAENKKRAISPIKVIESGKSTLTIASIKSTSGSSSSKDQLHVSESSASEDKDSVSDNKSSNLVSDGSKNEGHNSDKEGSIIDILKCDYCDFHKEHLPDSDTSLMKFHLKDKGHYSASVYSAKKRGEKIEIVNVKTTLFVLEHPAQFRNIIVKCPDCKSIFGDVFQCGMHYRHMHSQGVEKYALAPITSTKTVEFTADNVTKCLVCDAYFSSLKELNKHESNNNHYPFENVNSDKNNYTLIFLTSHNKIAVNSYCLVKCYIDDFIKTEQIKLGKHRKERTTVTLFIKTVDSKKASIKKIPPSADQTTLQVIQNDIAIFERYMGFHGHVLGNSKKADRTELSRLKALKAHIEASQPPHFRFS